MSIPCVKCSGEGSLFKSRYGGNDPDVWRAGQCDACEGSGNQVCEERGCDEPAVCFDDDGRALCGDCHFEWSQRLLGSNPMKDEVQRRNDLRRSVLDALNAAAPALECLNTRQEQCDEDGVMVKVSRQALDEVLSAVNEVAFQAAITPTPIADSSAQKSAPSSIGSLPSGESDPSVMLGFDGADTNSCPADSSEAGTGDMPFERFPRLAAHIERMANTPMAQSLEEWSNFIAELNAALSAPVGGPGDELRMLRERLGPRGLEVVQIEGRGHYVNEAVKAEIEKLRSADRYDHGYADGVEWAITRPPAPAVGAEDVARAANWKLVDGTMTTGESVIFDGSFIVAKVTRRQDAELILSLLSGQGGGK